MDAAGVAHECDGRAQVFGMLQRAFARSGLGRDTLSVERTHGTLGTRRIQGISSGAAAHLLVSEQRYVIDAPADEVFETYRATPPAEAWPRDRIEYVMAYGPGETERPSASWPGLREGVKIFADLFVDPPRGRLRVMVPVVVTRVTPPALGDRGQGEIRYDYLEGAVTVGYNRLTFGRASSEEGNRQRTLVVHRSEYRGATRTIRLVMPILQPILHVGFVDALHQRMKARIEGVSGAGPMARAEQAGGLPR